METIVKRLDLVVMNEDFVDTMSKEIGGIKSTTHGETSTSLSINGLIIQRIRSKLQISEWNMHMLKIVPKYLTSSQLQAKINVLRSKSRKNLQEKIKCEGDEDVFEIAQQIFQAIEEGKLEVFEELMKEKVKDWNFQLEEYGNMTPLLWAVLHGQRKIVKAIREHAMSSTDPQGSTKAMFWIYDKFGFRIMNVVVFAYLIVPHTSHDNVRGIFEDIRRWGHQLRVGLGYMDTRLQIQGYIHCKIYYGIKDTPTRYYVDDLRHLGFYMSPLHLAAWFAPDQATTEIIAWGKDDLHRPTGNGHTVFHLCAWKGRHYILHWLIHYTKCENIPLDVGNNCDNDRQSPLHFAVLSQDKDCVEILLRTEAIKVTVRNWKGYTPMEIATVLHATSPSIITPKDLERFGVTSFDIKSLGLTFDIINVNVNKFAKYGIHSIECKKDTTTLKDIISLFDGLDPEALQRDRQVYVDAANAILVGAALIASASFGAWLQPPLGYVEYYSNEFLVTQPSAPPDTYESFVAIKQHWIIQMFWIFNSLSFFFSIATVIAGADAALPKKGLILKEAVTSIRHGVIRASYLLFLSVLCIIGTFSTIGFAILPPIPKYRVNMYCTMAIGLAICGGVLIKFCIKLWSSMLLKPWPTKNQNPSL